jgi:hypothetical protein
VKFLADSLTRSEKENSLNQTSPSSITYCRKTPEILHVSITSACCTRAKSLYENNRGKRIADSGVEGESIGQRTSSIAPCAAAARIIDPLRPADNVASVTRSGSITAREHIDYSVDKPVPLGGVGHRPLTYKDSMFQVSSQHIVEKDGGAVGIR